MAKVRRKRRWVLWCSVVGLAVTLVAAAASEFGAVSWRDNTGGIPNRVLMYRSSVTVIYRFAPRDIDWMGRELFPPGWSYVRTLPPDSFERSWTPEFSRQSESRIGMLHVTLPLWLPAVMFAGGVWWGRRGGWTGAGVCRACGYDVSGSVGRVCPECGGAA